MDASFETMPGKKAIFVILDSDDEDCAKLKHNFMHMYQELGISIQVVFCIANEEMEAWLLGDSDALVTAYPMSKRQLLQNFCENSI